jgi:hypothetical protein
MRVSGAALTTEPVRPNCSRLPSQERCVSRRARVAAAGCRLGESDVHVEVPEPQMQHSAAGPVHDVCQQDDDQDDDHQPEEEHDDSGDDVPSYSSRSSHGLQLPGVARIIRNRRGAERRGRVVSQSCRSRTRRSLTGRLDLWQGPHHRGYLHPSSGVQISAILAAAARITTAFTPDPQEQAAAGRSSRLRPMGRSGRPPESFRNG